MPEDSYLELATSTFATSLLRLTKENQRINRAFESLHHDRTYKPANEQPSELWPTVEREALSNWLG